VLAVLLTSAVAIQNIPQPTPQQLATAEKAARMLQSYNRKPEGLDDAAWNTAKGQLQNAAKAALLYVAVVPGSNALAKNDCETAQSVYSKALSDYPDNAFIAYQLGQAYRCTVKATPAKMEEYQPKAIYEFARRSIVSVMMRAPISSLALTGSYPALSMAGRSAASQSRSKLILSGAPEPVGALVWFHAVGHDHETDGACHRVHLVPEASLSKKRGVTDVRFTRGYTPSDEFRSRSSLALRLKPLIIAW
jgi:hypothetical protein